jgi:hypothetical protein
MVPATSKSSGADIGDELRVSTPDAGLQGAIELLVGAGAEMAGRVVVGVVAGRKELGYFDRADLSSRNRATGMEGASRRGLERARDIALENDPLAA